MPRNVSCTSTSLSKINFQIGNIISQVTDITRAFSSVTIGQLLFNQLLSRTIALNALNLNISYSKLTERLFVVVFFKDHNPSLLIRSFYPLFLSFYLLV